LWADELFCGAISAGLAVFVGIAKGDTPGDADILAAKIASLRIFEDQDGKMNRDVRQVEGGVLLIPNFTLYANTAKGNRPSFDRAAPPDEARVLYSHFVMRVRESGLPVVTGVFQAHMRVVVENDGPVTLICDSPPKPSQDQGRAL